MEPLGDWRRSKYASEISTEDFEKEVTVAGWIQDIRNLGGIAFILLRDRTGVLQVTAIKKHHGKEFFKKGLRSEDFNLGAIFLSKSIIMEQSLSYQSTL